MASGKKTLSMNMQGKQLRAVHNSAVNFEQGFVGCERMGEGR